MTKLSPGAQAIIDAGRSAQSPSAATKAGVLSDIDRALLEPSAAASSLTGVAKVLIGSALVVAIGVGYFLSRSEGEHAPLTPQEVLAEQLAADVLNEAPAPRALPAVIPSDDQVEPNDELTASELDQIQIHEEGDAQDEARSRKPRKRPVSASDSLLAEQKLIGAAQRATRDGDYATAKSLLAQHRREFERGVLAPERKAVSAITSCLAGELEKGQSAAAAFLKSNARSPLASQVRKSCQLP